MSMQKRAWERFCDKFHGEFHLLSTETALQMFCLQKSQTFVWDLNPKTIFCNFYIILSVITEKNMQKLLKFVFGMNYRIILQNQKKKNQYVCRLTVNICSVAALGFQSAGFKLFETPTHKNSRVNISIHALTNVGEQFLPSGEEFFLVMKCQPKICLNFTHVLSKTFLPN